MIVQVEVSQGRGKPSVTVDRDESLDKVTFSKNLESFVKLDSCSLHIFMIFFFLVILNKVV